MTVQTVTLALLVTHHVAAVSHPAIASVCLCETLQLGSFYVLRLPRNDADAPVHQADRRQLHLEGTQNPKDDVWAEQESLWQNGSVCTCSVIQYMYMCHVIMSKGKSKG